jgi:hypothetical protein
MTVVWHFVYMGCVGVLLGGFFVQRRLARMWEQDADESFELAQRGATMVKLFQDELVREQARATVAEAALADAQVRALLVTDDQTLEEHLEWCCAVLDQLPPNADREDRVRRIRALLAERRGEQPSEAACSAEAEMEAR